MNFTNDFTWNGKFFEVYLKLLGRQPAFIAGLGPTHAFLQISGLNKFISESINYQSLMMKKVGGQYTTNKCWKCLQNVFRAWRKRWFAVTCEGVYYSKKYSTTSEGVIDMLFFDKSVKIRFGKQTTGQDFGK
jgi:hypothetical protein